MSHRDETFFIEPFPFERNKAKLVFEYCNSTQQKYMPMQWHRQTHTLVWEFMSLKLLPPYWVYLKGLVVVDNKDIRAAPLYQIRGPCSPPSWEAGKQKAKAWYCSTAVGSLWHTASELGRSIHLLWSIIHARHVVFNLQDRALCPCPIMVECLSVRVYCHNGKSLRQETGEFLSRGNQGLSSRPWCCVTARKLSMARGMGVRVRTARWCPGQKGLKTPSPLTFPSKKPFHPLQSAVDKRQCHPELWYYRFCATDRCKLCGRNSCQGSKFVISL